VAAARSPGAFSGIDLTMAVFARADVDLEGRGGVAAPGAIVRFGPHIDAFANALVGANGGAEVGGRLAMPWRSLRAFATVSAPMFFVDGFRPNVRGGVGAEWIGFAPLRFGVELAVAHALSRPDDVVRDVLVGSLAVAFDVWQR
jgi:hypothetical protein